jgi:hypothetical protein
MICCKSTYFSCNTQTLLKSNLQSTFLDPNVKTRELKSKMIKYLTKLSNLTINFKRKEPSVLTFKIEENVGGMRKKGPKTKQKS